MSLIHHIKILPLHCRQPAQGIEICPVDSLAGEFTDFADQGHQVMRLILCILPKG